MRRSLKPLRSGYGKTLISLHRWNAWIVLILTLTGFVLLGGFWRELLGEGRMWVKWLHIAIGLVSILPVFYYLLLAGKHWKRLRGKPRQRTNVVAVLVLLFGWFGSGVLLWQYQAIGPSLSNIALITHDLLTWIGLPYLIYHSLTRTKWLKEPHRRTVTAATGREMIPTPIDSAPSADVHVPAQPAEIPQPIYTRREFIRWTIGTGLALTIGPSFLKWLGGVLGGPVGSRLSQREQLSLDDVNKFAPAPRPLPASSPPAGGGARGHFRIFTVTAMPEFHNDNWSFTVDGQVERPIQWNWEQFLEQKRTVQVSDFHCVTGWSVYSNTWEGIPLAVLLQQAGVKPQARAVKFYSGDGVYTDSLTLEQAQMEDVMVALLHDGQQIPRDLGGPVRLVVPQMYAYKSVKWLTRIELIEDDHTGYWEQRGYSKDAWIRS